MNFVCPFYLWKDIIISWLLILVPGQEGPDGLCQLKIIQAEQWVIGDLCWITHEVYLQTTDSRHHVWGSNLEELSGEKLFPFFHPSLMVLLEILSQTFLCKVWCVFIASTSRSLIYRIDLPALQEKPSIDLALQCWRVFCCIPAGHSCRRIIHSVLSPRVGKAKLLEKLSFKRASIPDWWW